jgi:hypothetical protein
MAIPPEYAYRAPNYLEGRQAGRAGPHDAPPLSREWFFSDAKFEAYVAGWNDGSEERTAAPLSDPPTLNQV